MHRTLLLITLLTTGCAQYCGVDQPLSGTPVYPPMYDTKPVKQLLWQTQTEVLKLEQFVDRPNNNLLRLQSALDAYKYAAKDLYYEIQNAPDAAVIYHPWQIQH